MTPNLTHVSDEVLSILFSVATYDPFDSGIPGKTVERLANALARNKVDPKVFVKMSNRIKKPRTIDRILALMEYGYIKIHEGLSEQEIQEAETVAMKDMVEKARAAGFGETSDSTDPCRIRDGQGRQLRKNLPPGYQFVTSIRSGDAYFPEVASVVSAPVTRIVRPGDDPNGNPKHSFWGFITRVPVKS